MDNSYQEAIDKEILGMESALSDRGLQDSKEISRCPEAKSRPDTFDWCNLSDNPCFKGVYPCGYYEDFLRELNTDYQV